MIAITQTTKLKIRFDKNNPILISVLWIETVRAIDDFSKRTTHVRKTYE